MDAGGRAICREYYIRATDRVKVQVIVQWGWKSPDHPRDSESSGGRRGWRGGGGGWAAGDELSVVIELEVGHLGSSSLVVLQLIVAVIGWVVATLRQIGTQTGCAEAAGSHTLSKCAFCNGQYGQTVMWLGRYIVWSVPSQFRSFPLFLLFFSRTIFIPWYLRKGN